MKKILIFGGAGSLGTQLTEYYYKTHKISIASRDEAKHWELLNHFSRDKNIKTFICDVRDYNRVHEVLSNERPDIIFIAQALKQIDICETNPEESIKTNVNGVSNILRALNSLLYSPSTVCFVSTDKACLPTSVYGMCKSISEKLIYNASCNLQSTKFITVRYGNVLSSKGSIIPLLLSQVKDNVDHFNITNKEMTRFMMTLQEAVELIDTAINNGSSGDIWVPKLKSMKIFDLLTYFSNRFNKPIVEVGIRPGEKIHESMLSLEEASLVKDFEKYLIFNKSNVNNTYGKEYCSNDHLLTYDELKVFMDNYIK
jgi:FlaA1/EpsC-like NDP-sugar epimerase